MTLSIFLIVGAEVSMNTNIANILIAKFDLVLEKAAIGISVFFAGEMLARLGGAIILNWIKPRSFLLLIAVISLLGVAGVLLAPTYSIAFVCIFIIGLGAGSMFRLFSRWLWKKYPSCQ